MGKRNPRKAPRSSTVIRAAAPEPIRFTGAGEALELLAEVDRDGAKLRPFSMTAYTGAAMNVPQFFEPVVVDLTGLRVPTQRLPIFRQHDPDRIAGHSESIEVSAQRLRVGGVMSGTGPAAGEVLGLAANGFPWQSSIGAEINRREFVEQGHTVKVNGRNFSGPINVARDTTLKEVSFVPLGADPGTSATFAAGQSGGIDMQFADWLKARGINLDTLNDEGRKLLEAAFKADTAPKPPAPGDPPPPGPGPGTLSARAAAARRIETAELHIETKLTEALEARRITSADYDEIRGLAFANLEQWTDDRLELEFIRRARPKGTGVQSTPDGQAAGEVIEAALCMCGGLANIDKAYPERVCEAARQRWKAGLSIGELVVMTANRNGYRGHSIRGNLKEVLQAALWSAGWPLRADAGPSTYSIPNILANVANKFALAGFYSVDQTWSQIASRRPVNDFKLITQLRLLGNLQFLRLPPGGEIKAGEIGELAYHNQAHTFARTIGISREDWINDDTGALTGSSRELGIGGGDALNNEFWTVFLNNGAFFSAGNNNVAPAGVFSLQSLAAADNTFRLQTKPNGRPLGIIPSLLIVPTPTRIPALNAINSTIVVSSTTTDKPLPNSNILQGAYKVLSSPYMSNAVYTGNSSTAFYLGADPAQLAMVEGCFLFGVEIPTIETATFDWDQLGTSFRGYLDFGFALQEYRAGVRAPGI